MAQKIRFQIELNSQCVLKHEAIALLEAVARLGSIRQAAIRLGRSYRYAWEQLDALNRSFDEPVTRAEMGGVGGGGVWLTPFGIELMKAVDNIRRQIEVFADAELKPIATKARIGGRSA